MSVQLRDLTLESDGAAYVPTVLSAQSVSKLCAALPPTEDRTAGLRLCSETETSWCLSHRGPLGQIAASHLGRLARPVRAILFDKNPASNWSVGWHQDRTIAVKERIEVAGFGPWSVKRGMLHVEPPISLVQRMLTIRLHLDPVPSSNSPLKIAIGSHKIGKIPEDKIASVVSYLQIFDCLAERGDAWIYVSSILHSSKRSRCPSRRRVLHVDYASEQLPGGLQWLGI